ncbi:MAG: membrane protein insertase YidC [Clostridia bacterium]|nr:membrane protein insertase YidC [Clostridia bacterium]
MDFINTALVTLSQPKGFWPSILNAFKGGVGSYVVAVILIAIIVRILFSAVDIVNKKVNMKNSAINEKMRPELEAVQKKYGNDQRVLQQKQSEIYRKYQFSMMGSCLPMLIAMVLQFTVFLTLWNSLQAVSNFNIVDKYENMKNVYANVIALNDNEQLAISYEDGDTLTLEFDENELGEKTMSLILTNEATSKNQAINGIKVEDLSNETVLDLLDKYVIEHYDDAVANSVYKPKAYSQQILELAQEAAKEYYKETQESFLWIKNIYKSESPTSPLFTKSEIMDYLTKYYKAEDFTDIAKLEEEKMFDCVIGNNTALKEIKDQKNGFYILTIIAVLSSFLSTWLSNKLMKGKNSKTNANGQPQSKMMYIMMPLVFGLFTFMYTSLFAIYIIVGQLVMIALTPLTSWVVKKWIANDAKKQKAKDVIDVDYRRKDM